MPRDDLIRFLRSTELLGDLPDGALAAVAAQMHPLAVEAGTVLFEQDVPGDAAYLILDGEIALVADGVELLRRGRGGFVGEFALIDDQPRSAAAVARSPLRLLAWQRDAFLEALSLDPQVARAILRALTRKLRRAVDSGVDLLHERDRWQHDLSRAREIQSAMLPPPRLEVAALEVAGCCAPAGAVGGDFYDVLALRDGVAGVMALDVTGHGFYSSLFVAMAKSCLHTQARTDPSPDAMLRSMRRTLDLSLDRRMLMTCAYLLLEPAAGRLRYANAGHPHPLHRSAASGAVTPLEVLDPILGAQEAGGARFQCREAPFAPGDLLLIYSDGVTEARSPAGEEFGRPRLEAALAAAAGASAEGVRDAMLGQVYGHAAGQGLRDDLTLVVVRSTAGRAP